MIENLIKKKRAAHFLFVPELAYSPPNDAIVNALLELDYNVDLFAPGGDFNTDRYGSRVTSNSVEYGKKWLIKYAISPRWRKYNLFSGTSEDPIAIVGILSFLYRRPSFTLADEIKSGAYSGDRSQGWKSLCRWAMRKSNFTIVNDETRIKLQREYAVQNNNKPIIVYPGCFRTPPKPIDRIHLREKWNIPSDALVICFSGGFNLSAGAEWLIKALLSNKHIYIVLQPLGLDYLTRFLLLNIKDSERTYIENNRLTWRDSWASMGGVDIGLAIYLNDAPQFQLMGTSSNRLCMFLAMGVPVIASRQPSFEFIEQYKCGVLVDNEKEFIDAIDYIQDRLEEMKRNALLCAREYIDAPGKYKILLEKLSRLPS